MSNDDGPFKEYRHKPTIVQARKVKRYRVVKTDRGKITLHPEDWEIVDAFGTTYANDDEKFEYNFEDKE